MIAIYDSKDSEIIKQIKIWKKKKSKKSPHIVLPI